MKKKNIILLSTLVLLIDQAIKFIIINNMALFETIKLNNILKITYVKNTGGAFSILSGNTLFLSFIAVVCLMLFYRFFIYNKTLRKIDVIFYSLFIGGVLSNAFDRLIHKSVIDYIDVNLFNFPIFNLADICIVISICVIVFDRGDFNGNKSNIR